MTDESAFYQILRVVFAVSVLVLLALPLLIVGVYGELPYIHDVSYFGMFLMSSLWFGVVLFFCVYLKKSNEIEGGVFSKLAGGVLILALGSALGAPTLMGFVSLLCPDNDFSSEYLVSEVARHGSSFRAGYSLGLFEVGRNDEKYLFLSKKIVFIRDPKIGDRIVLSGKESIFGRYVYKVRKVLEE